MFSLNHTMHTIPRPQPVGWTEGARGFITDSYPDPKNCLSRLGGALLIPLDICGRGWQLLPSQGNEGALQKVSNCVKKILLSIAIAFALVPGIMGSLIKCVSNSALMQNGNFQTWEIETSEPQRAQCQQMGLYNFNQDAYSIRSAVIGFSQEFPEYPQASSIHVRRNGHQNYFTYTVTIPMNAYGVSRPNGDGFTRNIVNSFKPSIAPQLEFRQIKVLQDLLLGIRSGTAEDYRRIQEHLACCTKLEFTTHWSPNPQFVFDRSLDLKICY